jgi:glycosyltransferase involved in cell wall biosynthesis
VITVSETSRADLLRFLPLKEDRLHVIHNGIERPSFPNAGRVEELLAELNLGRPYLLYAGSYEPRKNVLGAVEAYALASNQRELPDMALLVERESGYRDQVMKAVRRRGLGGRLHFLHSLSEEALIALYRGASMLLFPSHYEGFGYPPLLGLACGIPVIASDRGSLPELLGDSVLYVDPDSPSDMSRAVLNLMENPDIAAQFAAHGRAHAQRYQWVEAAERTYQVYMRVIGRASPADDHGSSHHGVRLHEERLDG